MKRISRRTLVVGAILTTIGAGAAALTNFLYPRVDRKAEGKYRVEPRRVPLPGESPYIPREDKFALVNLLPGEGNYDSRDHRGQGGLIAVSRACTHLKCTLPWVDNFSFPSPGSGETIRGWFRCACHGSTYTKAGVRVFGPASRSLDTLGLRVRDKGAVEVDTFDVTPGNDENPLRATPYQRD